MPSPPRPMSERQGRPLVVSSGAITATILTILVLALVAYVVGELLIFSGTPDLRITDPAADLLADEGTVLHIQGSRSRLDHHHRGLLQNASTR